jgi:hypothetical protein
VGKREWTEIEIKWINNKINTWGEVSKINVTETLGWYND